MRARLRLWWAAGPRELAARPARAVLAIAGIAAGVALVVATVALSSSISASVDTISQVAASDADLEVRPTAGQGGLSAQLLAQLRDLDGIQQAGAAVESRTELRSSTGSQQVLLLGVDRGLIDLAAAAPGPQELETADALGLALPLPLADDLAVGPGDGLEVLAPGGWQPLRLGVVLDDPDIARARIAVAPIGVVQQLLDRGEQLDVIYLQAPDADRMAAAVQQLVGEAGQVGPVGLERELVDLALDPLLLILAVASLVALLVGGFLVYNTMSMLAVERIRQAATLRALGAHRRQLTRLLLGDAALLGAVGSLAGLGAGLGLAHALLQRDAVLEQLLPITITGLALPPALWLLAPIAGVATAIAAAWLPARGLARHPLAHTLARHGALEATTSQRRRWPAALGAVLATAGLAIVALGMQAGHDQTPATLGGLLIVLAGLTLTLPVALPALAQASIARLAAGRRTPALLRLAVAELVRAPARTAYTAGAMLLAISLIVMIGVSITSYTQMFQRETDATLRADLYVTSPTWHPFGVGAPLDAALIDQIDQQPDVAFAFPYTNRAVRLDDGPALLMAYDTQAHARLPAHDATTRQRARQHAQTLADPDAILVSGLLLTQHGYDIGDTLALPTPNGEVEFTIAGIGPEVGNIMPELYLDHDRYTQLWDSPNPSIIQIGLAPNADPEHVRQMLATRYADTHALEIQHRADYLADLTGLVDGFADLGQSVQLVAIIIAGLGLANTLLISTLERRRDIGTLRALGMQPRQLRRMITTQALLVTGLGLLPALAIGTGVGIIVNHLNQTIMGTPIPTVLPAGLYATAITLGLLAALVAATLPAHRAASTNLPQLLTYE